jgi:hypothetical protein
MSLQVHPLAKSFSTNGYKRFIAVICDVGHNHLIHFYWLLSSLPLKLVMESIQRGRMPQLFPTCHFVPSHIINHHGQ